MPVEGVSRRDMIKLGGAVAASGPAILKVRAASDQVKFGLIGTGSRGTYLLDHLAKLDNGHCTALCDVSQESLDNAANVIKTNPKKYKDYRELLADKDVEAVLIAVRWMAKAGVRSWTLIWPTGRARRVGGSFC